LGTIALITILIFNLAEFQQVIPGGIFDWNKFQRQSVGIGKEGRGSNLAKNRGE
jgi:hypothetical protein